MGCGSCGSGGATGCQNHGSCASGSCNRMNVHNWLIDLPVSDNDNSCKLVEVSFNNGSRKDFYKNGTSNHYFKGDLVTVEGVNGIDVGAISLTGELVRLQLKKANFNENNPDIRKVLRVATETDISKLKENKAREKEVLIRSRAIARNLQLEMKMAEVEIQADGRKATFFYIADDRVDFRELIKLYAAEFRVKVEMRQIGARQEAGKVGGIGSCGRELCCSSWLTDFKSVNTNAARYQNLSINQAKLSGQCGRLKCCLNYELDTYIDALQFFPNDADVLFTKKGRATLIKKDIFKNIMWYVLPESAKQYPVSIEEVKRIKSQNREGIYPEELEITEITTGKPKEVEPEYADLVGQISLRSLERNSRKRQKRGPGGPRENRPGDNRPPSGNRDQRRPEGKSNPNRPAEPGTANAPQRDKRKPQPKQVQPGGNAQAAGQPKQGGNPNRPPKPRHPQGNNRQNRPPRPPQNAE